MKLNAEFVDYICNVLKLDFMPSTDALMVLACAYRRAGRDEILHTVEKILEEYLQGSVPEPLVCEDISRFLMALWRQDPKGADVRGQIEEVEAKLIETKTRTATPEEHPHQLLLRAEREKDCMCVCVCV